ncbi:hypothetical protein [Gordonia sp. NB41Y]|uniref:hypothetical protein n=1 Tax=Gordonia sp. NB41Y TaxID=875808 RepID=UPI0006B20E5B|nr:hypothetical protein [Gordonia sp. NB41Y]KOY49674.1 hypothetical protein ISGA_08660 [Gordonia sp. NB41Y]WLP92149.1 hypothetical protein Q9K23_07940 [Gordonia sp. NB41Y]
MTTSQYEMWVETLRRWRTDPSTDLSRLPLLQADSLPVQAYQRLFVHLGDAIQTMMNDFAEKFARDLGAARSEHDIARTLVNARPQLARRIQLARHPGLPPEVQRPLLEAAERDLRALQQELEQGFTGPSSRYGSDRGAAERLLHLARQNSFTAILAPGFPLESLFNASGAVPAAPAPGRAPSPPSPPSQSSPRVPIPTRPGPVRRRVFFGDAAPGAHPSQ